MQKAIIIQTHTNSDIGKEHRLDASELNKYLAEGWTFVSAAPFGVSASRGGQSSYTAALAAILVIIEKP